MPPILSHKHYDASSLFTPESLLREARRQKGLSSATVPEICILDPDGDIVRHLRAEGSAERHLGWACYHTDLYVFRADGHEYGIVGCAVGAAFAVLIAEELFASGCRFLVSVTSAGQIFPVQTPPYFIIINRALRDEGTSYHYLPPSDYSEADAQLTKACAGGAHCGRHLRAARCYLDDRCSLSGNAGGDRRGVGDRNSRGGDGGGGALRLREGARPICALLRPCH